MSQESGLRKIGLDWCWLWLEGAESLYIYRKLNDTV